MGEEAFDEFEIDAGDGRILVIRGGYCRENVLIGICAAGSEPDDLVSVNGRGLRRVLASMQIGEPRRRAKET